MADKHQGVVPGKKHGIVLSNDDEFWLSEARLITIGEAIKEIFLKF